ncbi:hypothetical protein AK812_SmicGene31333 [Symbiodinium microadriaticum]|uniref:EF-hand domain-containing protein n=1 Tax=Symbiodinium microadriaticum TaxID=2951 RepID=A0A1Q9CWY7_SYMMI|nr:hypothetical protein AK812_SmicGene31333 [Symbiodinium microadriaticum]
MMKEIQHIDMKLAKPLSFDEKSGRCFEAPRSGLRVGFSLDLQRPGEARFVCRINAKGVAANLECEESADAGWLREALHVARATMVEAVERQHDIILQEIALKLEARDICDMLGGLTIAALQYRWKVRAILTNLSQDFILALLQRLVVGAEAVAGPASCLKFSRGRLGTQANCGLTQKQLSRLSKSFFRDATNWFDTSLVMLWLADLFLSQHMLLLLVQTTIAFCLTQILGGFFHAVDVSQKIEIFQYFGTASRAMFTMFELTLEYFAIFNVAYKLVVGFAAVGIINAVFMQETFKVASSDDNVMMRQKDLGNASLLERDLRLHTKKMKTLFEAADESGDGVIDLDEFRKIFELEEIRCHVTFRAAADKRVEARTWLSAQDLPVSNPDLLFKLLDDGDGGLTADSEELVKGVDRLKGSAKGMDLEAFVMEHRALY